MVLRIVAVAVLRYGLVAPGEVPEVIVVNQDYDVLEEKREALRSMSADLHLAKGKHVVRYYYILVRARKH